MHCQLDTYMLPPGSLKWSSAGEQNSRWWSSTREEKETLRWLFKLPSLSVQPCPTPPGTPPPVSHFGCSVGAFLSDINQCYKLQMSWWYLRLGQGIQLTNFQTACYPLWLHCNNTPVGIERQTGNLNICPDLLGVKQFDPPQLQNLSETKQNI